tara:strand:+ start:403 stop:1974 length:1572 start_codon:yes stop_codon:yes gene_type:complete
MDKKLIEVRKRLREDFPLYSKHALKIRTKDGTIEPLILNPAQQILQKAVDRQLKAEGKIRIIILKARQQGLSTYVGGYLYFQVSQARAKKAMVITHHADSTRALFDLTKRYHDHIPEILKPHTKYSSRREISFDALDSSYVVATAGGDNVGRGETLTHLHASELAFWSPNNASQIWNGLIQAVPDTEGTAVFIESTANGVSGIFYDLWKGALEGSNGFIPVFIPWFTDPTYREKQVGKLDKTPEEKELQKLYKLDNQQLRFRRKRVAQTGLDLFKQEYPANADEAFLTTGRPVFNPEQLQKRMQDTPAILQKMALENSEFVNHNRGELQVYKHHDAGETYYIGADVSLGVRGGDWSCAQVLDSKKRQIATWRGMVHPDYFADVLYALGMYYNTAYLIVENNNHGILTCTRLGKDMAYPNFYQETTVDKITEKESITLGFRTTVKTKPLVIDQLRASMRQEEIELNDKLTIREMMTYIVTETGAMEAEQGCHDDTVVALALVNHIHEGKFTPIEVTNDFYIEAV